MMLTSWIYTLCNIGGINQCFQGTNCLHLDFIPEDGDSRLTRTLINVSNMANKARRSTSKPLLL